MVLQSNNTKMFVDVNFTLIILYIHNLHLFKREYPVEWASDDDFNESEELKIYKAFL